MAACPLRSTVQDGSDVFTDDECVPDRRLTPLEQLNLDMCQDDRVVREIAIGRRIGFYKIRGEIGCGNFSHVKLGVHALTRGITPGSRGRMEVQGVLKGLSLTGESLWCS